MRAERLALVIAIAVALGLPRFVYAQESPAAVPSWLPSGATEVPDESAPDSDAAAGAESAAVAAPAGSIPPGTVINSSNWSAYQQYMTVGEIGLWQGKWFWKMPADAQIKVAATTVYPLPTPFVEDSEKYGDQTRIEKQADGRWVLKNYVAGVPFPIPDDPNKGQKILTNLNYRIQPHLIAGFDDSGTPLTVCNMDRLADTFCWKLGYDVRQLAYNWEPGVPRTEAESGGAWLGEWIDVDEPEQYRYATDLVLLYQDNLRIEDNFLFVPSLRRSLRLSDAAHCSKIFTFADYTHDDIRGGWNGGIADFDSTFVKRMQLLALVQMNTDDGAFPDHYDMPLGWAKPSWGDWELRDTWVIDVRPRAAISGRYCYGKRVLYIDTNTYAPLAQDLYDNQLNFAKIIVESLTPAMLPPYGMQSWAGGGMVQIWDVTTNHAAFGFTAGPNHRSWTVDAAVKPQYNNIKEYQNPGAIMNMMR
ncbi:MAG TPA: DUF1329 domain-containing protein [Candidatus Binataceae bacterium]|nr:DUF1329 domain-containing protein [Candidatus Binataceae bacterium]